MMTNRLLSVVWLYCLCLAVNPSDALAAANDLRLQTLLIWGTNDEKHSDPKLREVDGRLVEKLKKVFKWNRYFEVSQQVVTVADSKSEKRRLSEKCEVEIKNMGKSSIEVKLFGEGKLVRKVIHPMLAGESLVLAGDDKNDTAWFVVIMPK